MRAGNYNFFYGKVNENCQMGTGFFVHHRTVSAVKRVESDGDRMSYIVLRGRWCNIIILIAHAPSEEKCDDSSVTSVNTYLPTPHNIREKRKPPAVSAF